MPPSCALKDMSTPGHRGKNLRLTVSEIFPNRQEPKNASSYQDHNECQTKGNLHTANNLTLSPRRLCESVRKSPLSCHWEASDEFLRCLIPDFLNRRQFHLLEGPDL